MLRLGFFTSAADDDNASKPRKAKKTIDVPVMTPRHPNAPLTRSGIRGL